MKNNYDRFKLLKEALLQESTSMDELCKLINTDPISLQEDLQNHNELKTIKAVARAIGIPEAYFWGGLKYENGNLVENSDLSL